MYSTGIEKEDRLRLGTLDALGDRAVRHAALYRYAKWLGIDARSWWPKARLRRAILKSVETNELASGSRGKEKSK